MQYHHYSLTELESMMPWERKTYLALVSKHVQQENEKVKQEIKQELAKKGVPVSEQDLIAAKKLAALKSVE